MGARPSWLPPKLLRGVPQSGPGTKARRQALTRVIGYLQPRLEMTRYGEWLAQDLVIASGQVERAVRHLVGERFDCAGMRWTQQKAEALLHLRCIELNGDWAKYVAWFQGKTLARLKNSKRVKILTNQPIPLSEAA